ncbi:hypothetical protein MKW94_007085 [Papaver nudicaule]|uniref:Uncharacterized protein n=1 Tax=Papaver nudicaule TaxID=74823 RepID=A0AA42B3Y5_PAPNU|nr:hypothetical protein [Papaver nudicaule]
MDSKYYTDPSGTFWQCDAKAIGSGSEGADSSLQEQFNKVSLSLMCSVYFLHYIAFNGEYALVSLMVHAPME